MKHMHLHCRARRLLCCCSLVLACMLASCATNGTALSIGGGSGGFGVGMHSGYGYGYGWPGLSLGYGRGFGHRHWGHGRQYGGVMVGIPVSAGPGVPVGYADYPVGEVYPVRRVIPLPHRGPISEADLAHWNRWDTLYHSPLPYYRGRPFTRKK